MTSRRLAAEVRAVEDGQTATRVDDFHYTVKGRDFPDLTYDVHVTFAGGAAFLRCNHRGPTTTSVDCKHTQVVARRLEREGRVRFNARTDTWDVAGYETTPLTEADWKGMEF